MTAAPAPMLATTDRVALVRRGQTLSFITIGYNALEGVVAVTLGALAGSISLVGFGADSVIEVSSGVASLWRLRADVDPVRRERIEAVTLRIVGVLFLALALYVAGDAIVSLLGRQRPAQSYFGIALAVASLIVMPLLARAKRRVASGLSSRALAADATQTNLCAYLSAILLGGLALNAFLGWWWADPIAALAMTPFIAKEGLDGLRGEHACDECA
jgi:divalent metal cation (Fe/Co/Zn/Cd) transporter